MVIWVFDNVFDNKVSIVFVTLSFEVFYCIFRYFELLLKNLSLIITVQVFYLTIVTFNLFRDY